MRSWEAALITELEKVSEAAEAEKLKKEAAKAQQAGTVVKLKKAKKRKTVAVETLFDVLQEIHGHLSHNGSDAGTYLPPGRCRQAPLFFLPLFFLPLFPPLFFLSLFL